jgi:hypothetical protein
MSPEAIFEILQMQSRLSCLETVPGTYHSFREQMSSGIADRYLME